MGIESYIALAVTLFTAIAGMGATVFHVGRQVGKIDVALSQLKSYNELQSKVDLQGERIARTRSDFKELKEEIKTIPGIRQRFKSKHDIE